MILLSAKEVLAGESTIFCDNHVHTNWTDGQHSVTQMVESALSRKISSLCFSEHSSKESFDWFPLFVTEVQKSNSPECSTLVGTEVRIVDYEGTLNLSDEVAQLCDFVVASVHRLHRPLSLSRIPRSKAQLHLEVELQMMLGVLRRNSATVLGHPFGMYIQQFGPTVPEEVWSQLISEASRSNVALEFNSKYHEAVKKLFLGICADAGLQVSVGSDAHSRHEVAHCWKTLGFSL